MSEIKKINGKITRDMNKYIVKNIFEFATEEKAKSMYEEIN